MAMNATRLGAAITAGIDAIPPGLTPAQEAAVLDSMTALATAVIYEINTYYSGGGGGGGIAGPVSSTDNAITRWDGAGGNTVQNSVVLVSDAGVVTGGTWQGAAVADTYIASAATWNAKEPAISAGTTSQYWRGDKSWQTLDKSAVGLGNVENAAASGLYVPLTRTVNGHALSANISVTASDVGLGSVENTALSTWAGSTNLTTLGTIATGVWSGTAIVVGKLGTGTASAGKYLDGGGAWATLNSAAVGLGSVENAAASTLYVPLTRTVNGHALSSNVSVTASDVGLGAVENTALSTWAGSTALTTLGTVTTGTWSATAIGPTKGGTGATTYTLGDLLYSDATDSLAKLAGQTTTTRKFLRQTGNGTISAAPAWDTVTATDVGLGSVENAAASALYVPLTRTVSTTAPLQGGGDLSANRTLSIAAHGITAALFRQSAGLSVVGVSGAATADTADITASSNGDVLRVAGGVLGWGAIPEASVTNLTTDLAAKEPTITAGTTAQYWRGDKSWQTLDKSAVGLGSVENTALSTWAGTANITTLGTITTGTWSATTVALNKGGTGQTTAAEALAALGGLTQAQTLARASFRI